ncbi:c-type cytochrome [Henriciella aquimarina]|uniref:c-type cytochrome n=1 Tax=Henriciella aquimarina TaxID=545261 RepID=UPI0009FEBF83|nr:c-type cytochrome [Henriciella aquimarina]
MRQRRTAAFLTSLVAGGLFLAACDAGPEAAAPESGPPDSGADAPASTKAEDAEGHPTLQRPAALALSCSGCHATAGEAIPSLESQTQATLEEKLTAYRTETDGTTVMHRLMRGYSEADIAAISAYIAGEADQ